MKQNTIKIAIAILVTLILLFTYFFYHINFKESDIKNQETYSQINKVKNSENNFHQKSGPIVDQTISSNKSKQSISTKKEDENNKAQVILTLIDGNENKPLENHEINLKVIEFKNKSVVKNQSFKTDKNGNILVDLLNYGEFEFEIKANTFIIQKDNLKVLEDKNKMTIKLIRGGILELKVFDDENKMIELPITVSFYQIFSNSQEILKFDTKRGCYVFFEVPIGLQNIKIKSPGYIETDYFQTFVSSNRISCLEIKMKKAKTITFDIEAKEKPQSIVLYEEIGGLRRIENNLDYGNLSQEVFKNDLGLYEFKLERNGPVNISIYANHFFSYPITITNSIYSYKIKLQENLNNVIQVKNEKEQPIFGATIRFLDGNQIRETTTDIIGVGFLPYLEVNKLIKVNVISEGYIGHSENLLINNFLENSKVIVLKEGLDFVPMKGLPINFTPNFGNSASLIVLTKTQDLRKISFNCHEEIPFSAGLVIYDFGVMAYPMDVLIDKNKGYYLDINSGFVRKKLCLLFEPYGYEMVILGPYDNLANIPEEFQIELKKPQQINIKVLESQNNTPAQFVKVSLFVDELELFSTKSSGQGEVVFPSLNKKFIIKIENENYFDLNNDFEVNTKEIVIRLRKSCRLKIIDSSYILSRYNKVELIPSDNNLNQTNDYRFESREGEMMISQFSSGEYTFALSKIFGNSVLEKLEFPNKFFIEEDKILEINLQELMKENTK